MGISYNVQKSEAKFQERGLSFEAVHEFVMSSALIVEDCRNAYTERRYQALGVIPTGYTCWFSHRAATKFTLLVYGRRTLAR